MILNKKNFAVLVVLFLSSIPNSFASECYQINRKVCNFVLEPLGNNKERWQFYSDFYDCELNEQQYSDKMIKEYAKAKEKYSFSEIDEHIQQDQKSKSSMYRNIHDFRDELSLCFWQGAKKYSQNGSKSNASSNEASSSGSSSNQSSSPQPSTQTESIQSTTNTQTTNNKKGKKNPNDVPAKCVGFNHDKIKIVNKCNFPLNFSYCMLHQDDQNIQVANSCNDGFVAETIYPGRAISDESLNTRFFAIACKFPSKPINMRFISFDKQVEGNCQR